MLFILTIQEKRPADVLKASRKNLVRVTFLGRRQGVNFETLVQMHFHCIAFNFILSNVCLKHYRASRFILLGFWRNVPKTSYKGPKRCRDVHRTSILNITTKRISVVKFLVLVLQMFVLDTKKLVISYSFSLVETSYERPKNVSK